MLSPLEILQLESVCRRSCATPERVLTCAPISSRAPLPAHPQRLERHG